MKKFGLISFLFQGIFLLSVSYSNAAVKAKSVDSVVPSVQQPAKYKTDAKFMIGIFSPPSWDQTNDEQYKMIHDAHIDYIHCNNASVQTLDHMGKVLQLAKKYDLKVLVTDTRVRESLSGIKSMVRDYRNMRPVIGYNVANEPTVKVFGVIAKACKEIQELDKNRMTYVNLYPEWFVPNYESDYVNKWIQTMGKENIQYLSFDNYPFLANGTFRDSYFKNLDIIRRAGLNNKIRTASYLQAIGFKDNLRRPNATELEYSAFVNLAYGIKNIIWFTYWSFPSEGNKITTSIVDDKGNKTDLFDPFVKINDEVQQLGKCLIKLDALEVYQSGQKVPEGVSRIPETFFWQPESNSNDLIISHLKGIKSDDEYVMVVNKVLDQNQKVIFRLLKPVKQIKEISKETGKAINTSFDEKNAVLSTEFLPGEGKLYQIKFK